MRRIETSGAPLPIGPYSQAVESGGFVFVSGQLPLDPVNGEMADSDIRRQTGIVIDNVENILKEAGLGLASVVKVEIFLKDLGDFSAMNEEYSARFPGGIKPARYVVQAAALPKDSLIELACVAYKG